MFYDSAVTDLTFGDREIDYDKSRLRGVMEEFTTKYARTDETHDEALFAKCPRSAARRPVASKLARFSILAPSIPKR